MITDCRKQHHFFVCLLWEGVCLMAENTITYFPSVLEADVCALAKSKQDFKMLIFKTIELFLLERLSQ